eukprot:gene788-1044_t
METRKSTGWREPYSFEPFVNGLYGECGLLMHYDPRAAHDPASARPFYMNGEWILEKAHSVGHDLEFEMPNAILGTHNLTLFDLHSSRGCSCVHMGCRPVPPSVNNLMLRAIWERLTRRIDHSVLSVRDTPREVMAARCVPVHLDTREMISNMTAKLIAHHECPRFGCPFVPIAPIPSNYSNFHDTM